MAMELPSAGFRVLYAGEMLYWTLTFTSRGPEFCRQGEIPPDSSDVTSGHRTATFYSNTNSRSYTHIMRQKRAKAYKKQMNFYLHTFKFREPFQTLVDDEILLQCHKGQFDITKGLNRTIQAEAKPMITQCCMQALYLTNNQPAIELAKTFERRRCNHNIKAPKTPKDCIRSLVDVNGQNKHRYIVATQSVELRRKLQIVPGVPLVFMNRSVMVMEPASDATKKGAKLSENTKLQAGLNDAKVGYLNKEEDQEDEDGKKKKRKRLSEPNPLRVKKKKKEDKPKSSTEAQQVQKKRVRHHKSRSRKEGEETTLQRTDETLKTTEKVTQKQTKENDSRAQAEELI